MGLKLEGILSILLIGIISGALLLKFNGSKSYVQTDKKELEFTDITFTEVDTDKLQGHVYATYGRRDKGILQLENLVYYSSTISSLTANKGTYKGNLLYLYGNVILKEADGYTYETDQANYNQQSEILYITAPFRATRDKNVIKGDTLKYDTHTNKAFGSMINSILYTTEK